MPNQDHPVWFIGKALVILAFAALFAYNNANSFDETELKMLMELAVVLFGGAALESFFRKKDRLATMSNKSTRNNLGSDSQ